MKHLRLIPDKTKINFMGHTRLFLAVSVLMTVVSIASLFAKGLNYGIDFTGGLVIEVRTDAPADIAKVRGLLSTEKSLGEVALQQIGADGHSLMIRLQSKEDDHIKVVDKVKSLLGGLNTPIEYRKVEFVGPQVGQELIRMGLLSLCLSMAAMMVYIWFRFEWQFSVNAIVGLLYDAFLIFGLYSVTGLEFNLTSVAAILTIIGYSMNDKVVIYDRIRDNLRKYKKMKLDELINLSINETLARTLTTSGATSTTLVALILLGGPVIQGFSIAVLFGIVVGTYSSIYIASSLLLVTKLRADNPVVAAA